MEQQFTARLQAAITQSRQLGYPPTRIEQMLNEHGAVETARRLIGRNDIQIGMWEMVSRGHTELTVESIMLEPQFASLFTEAELTQARRRLQSLSPSPRRTS